MAENRQPVFQLDDIHFTYPDGETALDGINLQVRQGEKLVLLGANGSGKSTLLKLLDGLIYPTRGRLTAFGEEISEKTMSSEAAASRLRRRVGFVFQNSDVQLFNPTVRDEVAFGPLQLGLEPAEVEQRVADVLALLGLEQLQDRPPFKLSGGEKKRVALASVLSINPEVLLLDEPTNGLDPRTQRLLINLIRRIGEAGKTIITCTHNLEIIEEIADRVVVFSEDHHIAADGSCQEIMGDRELLIRANIIDQEFHSHLHGDGHRHYHVHP